MKKLILLWMVLVLTLVIFVLSPMSIYAESNEEEMSNEETLSENEQEGNSTRSIAGGEEVNGELWYGITVNNDVPVITYQIDYSESKLLDYLKPGDIVYERNAGLDLVDYIGHIALVVDVVPSTPTQQGYVLLIESMPNIKNPYTGEHRDLGVCYGLMTPTRFSQKMVSIMRVNNVTDAQIQGAIQFAKNHLGDDWLIKAWKDVNGNANNWYCSELIWAAYYHQGILLEPNNGTIVRPAEIYESGAVSSIMGYNSATNFVEKTDSYHKYSCEGDTYIEEHDYEEYNFCYKKCRLCDHVSQAQEHTYTYSYSPLNSENHYAYCACGDQIILEHTFYTLLDMKICFFCDYEIFVNHIHSYNYVPILSSKHRKSCSCGDSVIEVCVKRSSIDGGSICIYCGQETPYFPELLLIDNEGTVAYTKEDEEEYCN